MRVSAKRQPSSGTVVLITENRSTAAPAKKIASNTPIARERGDVRDDIAGRSVKAVYEGLLRSIEYPPMSDKTAEHLDSIGARLDDQSTGSV